MFDNKILQPYYSIRSIQKELVIVALDELKLLHKDRLYLLVIKFIIRFSYNINL